MKKMMQATLLGATLLSFALGCQSNKKTEASAPMNDTTTMVQSETVLSGPDSGAVMTETDQVITTDSTKK